MKKYAFNVMFGLLAAVLLSLAGCSRGANSSHLQVSGTASEGSFIIGETVTLVDANGTTKTMATDDTGYYSFNVENLTPPFLLWVEGTNGILVSFCKSDGTANINPITTEVVVLAAGTADMAALIDSITPEQLAGIETNFAAKLALVTASLWEILPEGAEAEHYFTDTITPGKDLDAFFDAYLITVGPVDGILVRNNDAGQEILLNIPVARIELDTNALLPEVVIIPPPASNDIAHAPPEIMSVVQNKAPTLALHQDEVFFPTNIDWYLRFTDLVYYDTKGTPDKSDDVLKRKSKPLNRDDLANLSNYRDAYLDRPTRSWDWFWDGIEHPTVDSPWTAYAAVARIGFGDREFLIVRYNTFYSFNTLSQKYVWDDDYTDHHYADWERVTVIFRKKDGEWVSGALLTRAHNNPVKMTYSEDAIVIDDRFTAYAALRSHGTHPDTTFDVLAPMDLCNNKGGYWQIGWYSSQNIEIVEYWEFDYVQGNEPPTSVIRNIDGDDMTWYKNHVAGSSPGDPWQAFHYWRTPWRNYIGPWGPHPTGQYWGAPAWSGVEVSTEEFHLLADYIDHLRFWGE